MTHKILLSAFIGFMFLALSYSQSKRSLEEEKKRLKEAIEEVRGKSKREVSLFKRYQEQRQRLLKKKKQEMEEIEKDIKKLKADLNEQRRQARKNEIRLTSFEKEEKKERQYYRSIVERALKKIDEGIPYAVEQRKSALMSLLRDIDSEVTAPQEALNRLEAFYQSELAMAYDADVRETIALHEGKRQPVKMLRLGRAVLYQVGKNTAYVYQKKDRGYHLSTKPLSLKQKRLLDNAILMIEGKKPPDLVFLPVLWPQEIDR